MALALGVLHQAAVPRGTETRVSPAIPLDHDGQGGVGRMRLMTGWRQGQWFWKLAASRADPIRAFGKCDQRKCFRTPAALHRR